jgi:hypothetical protein
MTWRRFMVLVRGLGPNSATAAKLTSRRYFGGDVRMSRSPQESENALAGMFGRAPAKVH